MADLYKAVSLVIEEFVAALCPTASWFECPVVSDRDLELITAFGIGFERTT